MTEQTVVDLLVSFFKKKLLLSEVCLADLTEGPKGALIRSRTRAAVEKLRSLVPLLTYWDDVTGELSLSSGNKGCLPTNLGPTLLRPRTLLRGKFDRVGRLWGATLIF